MSFPFNLETFKVKIIERAINDQLKANNHPGLMPTRSNPTDAGLDLYAAEDVLLYSFRPGWEGEGHRQLISTGIAVEIPPGLGLFIWDRSGIAVKHGIHRLAGVVDASFRGTVKVALVNLTSKDYMIHRGDRIAQAVLSPVILANPVEVDELSDTSRGSGGFGSTGR